MFGLPLHFRSRCGKRQSLDGKADKGRTEALHDGPAESEKHSESVLSADTFVLDREPDDSCTTTLTATSVTDPEAGPTTGKIRRFGSTRNHGDPIGLHGEQRVHVASEYWTAEDHSAIKRNNHRVHAIFARVQEANDYAQKFVCDVPEPYVKSDAWHTDDHEPDMDIDNVKASKTCFMDGTTPRTLDWAH